MNPTDLARLRREYSGDPLRKHNTPDNPFLMFRIWFEELSALQSQEANAMVLATADPKGRPSARTVLLKEYSENGFSFFTNYTSRKGLEIENNPNSALLFYWPVLSRQVRVEGKTEMVNESESNLYFSTRPRGSQIAAWASEQSSVISSKEILLTRCSELEKLHAGKVIPRPPHWGGYRIIPHSFEFWQGQPDRIHDRIVFRLDSEHTWIKERLAP